MSKKKDKNQNQDESRPTTRVLFVTDMSGSMSNVADDVRGGFNSFVDTLRADTKAQYRLTVMLFDDQFEFLCTDTALADVPVMDHSNYTPRGRTALWDAVGHTVTRFERSAKLGDGDRVLVVVQTDGGENASTEFSGHSVSALVKEREAGGKWSFLFFGADIDAWAEASRMGFRRSQTVNTSSTGASTRAAYRSLARGTRKFSMGASGQSVARAVAEDQGDGKEGGGDAA